VLRELEARGVEALDCFSVDNALVRPCDPLFVGYCADRRSDCGERLDLTSKASMLKTAAMRRCYALMWANSLRRLSWPHLCLHDAYPFPVRGAGGQEGVP